MGRGRLKHSVQIIDWENNDRHYVGKELGDEWWNQWVMKSMNKTFGVEIIWEEFREYERNGKLKTNGVGGI